MGKRKTLTEAAKDAKPNTELDAALATVRGLRAENNRLRASVGNWESLVHSFVQAAPAFPVPKKPTLRAAPTDKTQELVAILSDSHATESWTHDQTDGATEYGFDRFCQYLWYYGQEIIRVAAEERGKSGVKTLHVDILGDIYHGTLRLEDEVTNEFGSVPGIINVTSVLAQWLAVLAGHFSTIRVNCVSGNHGRMHHKTQSKRYVEENKDTLVYLIVKSILEANGLGGRVLMHVHSSRVATITRLGHRIRIGHGDHIRGGNSIATIPIYGLSREILRQLRKDIRQVRGDHKEIALIEYGHWHLANFLEDILLINGALCPTAPWAFDELGAMADPKQWVYFVSRRYAYGWMLPLAIKHGAGVKHGFVYDPDATIGQLPGADAGILAGSVLSKGG